MARAGFATFPAIGGTMGAAHRPVADATSAPRRPPMRRAASPPTTSAKGDAMPYTIPSSADTREQAILAVASAVKGEQATGGDGSVNTALDILADALAGEDVQVPMTDQGAILALAQYVGGGGGGGGTTADIWLWNSTQGSDNDVLPESVEYVKGLTEDGGTYTPVLEPLEFEAVTEQYMDATIYGVRVKDAPVGADILPTFGDEYTLVSHNIGYSPQVFPPVSAASIYGTFALAPIEGFVLAGDYSVSPI